VPASVAGVLAQQQHGHPHIFIAIGNDVVTAESSLPCTVAYCDWEFFLGRGEMRPPVQSICAASGLQALERLPAIVVVARQKDIAGG
jgi:hypothetical protein